MEMSTRRRSSRLRKRHVETVDRNAKSAVVGGSVDMSSKRGSNSNKAASETRASQSIGRRRRRSNSIDNDSSLTSLSTNKRTKRTTVLKSNLSVSTETTTRRQTRSLSRKNEMQTKSVTPSPGQTTTTNKFIFASAGKASHRRRKRQDDHSDDDCSKSSLPSGVINLYGGCVNESGTLFANFQSPIKTRSKTRRTTTTNQYEEISFLHRGKSGMFPMGNSYSTSSTPESQTIGYIRTYGEDYFQSLHDSERPVIYDPLITDSLHEMNKGKKQSEKLKGANRRTRSGTSNPFGSPVSRRSSSSSSLSTSSSMKVTPQEKKSQSYKAWLKADYNWTEPKRNPQPHQSSENTKRMSIQPQLTPKMRSILVDWMIELSEHFNFGPSTLHLAVTIVDRVLASGRFTNELTTSNSGSSRNSSNSSRSGNSSNYSSNSRSGNSSNSMSRSDRTRSTRSSKSANQIYDSDYDVYGDESDDDDDDDEDYDNSSKSTRCYMIPRDRFQLLGATCVWMACKIQETNPPKSSDIKYVSDHIYSKLQITRMERRVCNALNFSFFETPTPHQFLFEYMRASLAGCSSEQTLPVENNSFGSVHAIPVAAIGVNDATHSVFRDMTHYLLELGRLPYGPTGRNPSLLAAAAVYLARVTLGIPAALKNTTESSASITSNASSSASFSESDTDLGSESFSYYWTPTLKYYTGYDQNDLRKTVLEVHEYHMAAESSNLRAVFNKYKSKNYHRVALKTVVRVEDLGF